jgi:hypothetical protein
MQRKEKEPDTDTDVVKTTIRVRRDLWKAVMHRSIDEERSLQDILELALEQYLKRGEGRK